MDLDLHLQLTDDIQELSLERHTPTQKSAEELEKLTVDEKLTDIERAVFLLSSGQEVQRISVITNLPDLLKDSNAECLRRVIPKVREVLHVAQTEMQLAASAAFLQILQKELVPIQNYTQTFLQTILMSVDSRDPDVASAWLDTLLDVIDLLPKDVIKRDVLGIAVAKGQLAQSVQSRLACCRILGKVATKFDPFVIKKEILPVVQSLCQDVDYDVRGCMCRQLDSVARGLGLEATKSAILPELVELTNDEECSVRLAGLETVVNILTLLDDDTCSNTIIPLVCKFCQQALHNEDMTLPVVAKTLGKLCHGLSGTPGLNLTEEQKQWFLDYYKKLCKVGLSDKNKNGKDPENSPTRFIADMFEEDDRAADCRKNAAFNFPAMVIFAGSRSFKTELYPSFSALCNDPHVLVRKTMAACFHEVTKLLNSSVLIVQADLIVLLKDDSTEVLKGIVSNLPLIIDLLAKSNGQTSLPDTKVNSFSELSLALTLCEAVIFSSHNWRLQEDFMGKLSCLPKCYTSDQIHLKFIPIIYNKLHKARALPVKHAAARTLLILVRQLRRLEQRQALYSKLKEEFCHSKSCYKRSLFIDVCKIVIELYSKAFFKQYFYECLLELASDPVPNVRLRLCSLLPKLKALVKLPTDRGLLQQLDGCVHRLLVNEKDTDVMTAVRQAVEELDRIQVQMESLTKRRFFEEDLADQKKEEEERLLIETEEKEKKDEEAKAAKEGKKKETKNNEKGGSKIPARKGTKIPAATSLKPEKTSSAGRDRSSNSSLLPPPGRDNKRTNTAPSSLSGHNNNTPGSGTKLRVGAQASNTGSPRLGSRGSLASGSSSASSTGSRRGSSGSVASSSSPCGSAGSRRGSLGSPTDVKNSPSTSTSIPRRKSSSSGMASGASGLPPTGARKKFSR